MKVAGTRVWERHASSGPALHLDLGLPLLKFPTGCLSLSRPDQPVRGPPPLPAFLEVPPSPFCLWLHEAVEDMPD